MEKLLIAMQEVETGVPVRSQKLFLTLIPSAFMGKFLQTSKNLQYFFRNIYKILTGLQKPK